MGFYTNGDFDIHPCPILREYRFIHLYLNQLLEFVGKEIPSLIYFIPIFSVQSEVAWRLVVSTFF